jgi:hypothetical protein
MKYLMALTLVLGGATLVACNSQEEETEVVQEVADAESATLSFGLM